MGQAKQRGTFEERKAQAIERERVKAEEREAARQIRLERIRESEPYKKLERDIAEDRQRDKQRERMALVEPKREHVNVGTIGHVGLAPPTLVALLDRIYR